MADRRMHEDESISVLDDNSSPEGTVPLSGTPEFHMYTGPGAEEGEASHYALNLSYQVLQKRKRDLEQQVKKLQRENNKIKKKSTGAEADMSLSPPPTLLVARGVSPPSPAAMALTLNGETTKALENFSEYLQKELERCEAEKKDVSTKLDQEKTKNGLYEQMRSDLTVELDNAKRIASARLSELETTRVENELLKSSHGTMKSKIEEFKKQNGNIVVLTKKLRDLEGQVFSLQGENSSLQQLYEEAASKNDHVEKLCEDLKARHVESSKRAKEKEDEIRALKASNQDLVLQRKSLEELNEFYQSQLDRAREASGRSVNGLGEGATHDEDVDMDQNESFMSLNDTRRQIVDLHRQMSEMQEIIKTQTGLIQALASKLQQKSRGSASPSPPSMPQSRSHGSHGSRDSVFSNIGHPTPPPPVPMSRPILCEEDILSLGNEETDEMHTLVILGDGSPGNHVNQNSTVRLDQPSDAVVRTPETPVRGEIVRRQSNRSSVTPSSYQISPTDSRPQSGMVVNGDVLSPQQQRDITSPFRTPTLNFSAQAIPQNKNNTEPIIRHPPAPGVVRRSSTEPLTHNIQALNGFGPKSPAVTTSHMTVERNVDGPDLQARYNNLHRLPQDASHPRDGATPPAGARTDPILINNNNGTRYPEPSVGVVSNGITRPRVPTEQSDVVPAASPQGSTPKHCPVCAKTFSMTQDAFEYHVNQCLTSSENLTPPPTPAPTARVADVLRECPVCSQLQPPGQDDADFLRHVESHFPAEFEVLP